MSRALLLTTLTAAGGLATLEAIGDGRVAPGPRTFVGLAVAGVALAGMGEVAPGLANGFAVLTLIAIAIRFPWDRLLASLARTVNP